ncbi:MAG: hypothetical protein QXS98_03815 [Candidatus Nitrosocaldus sp.]
MPWLDSSDDDKVLPLKGEEDVKIIAYMPENYTPDPELEKEMYLTEEEERKVRYCYK